MESRNLDRDMKDKEQDQCRECPDLFFLESDHAHFKQMMRLESQEGWRFTQRRSTARTKNPLLPHLEVIVI